jgi:hypothetical protein
VDRVYVGILNQLRKIGKSIFDPELVPDLIELRPVSPADGVQLGIRMTLINRYEFSAKTQSDDGDAHFSGHDRFSAWETDLSFSSSRALWHAFSMI